MKVLPLQVITVGDQRVGLYEYGDPQGQPVLTFHGVPASRRPAPGSASPTPLPGSEVCASWHRTGPG